MNEPDRKRLGLERLGLERLGRKAGFWVVTAIVSGVVAFMGNFVPDNWTTVPGIAVVIWVPAMFFAYYSWRKFGLESRKLRALELSKLPITSPDSHRATNESLAATSVEQGQSAQSDQPPVLYLRSFDKDQTTAKLKGTVTEEEHLTRLLTHIGPGIAIGRPGEKLPQVGARRLYVNDDEWRRTVEGLMKRSRLVAIRTGRSGGLLWEFRKSLELLRPEQLLLLVDSFPELDNMLAETARLSSTTANFRYMFQYKRSIGSIRAVVIFREDWKPFRLRLNGSRFWYTAPVNSSYIPPSLARTLRPLFEQLDVRWPKPALSGTNIMASFFIVCNLLSTIVLIAFPNSWDTFTELLGEFSGADPALIIVLGLLLVFVIGVSVAKKVFAKAHLR
jgi:hypothetical protein